MSHHQEHAAEDDGEGRAREPCPVCLHFNSPPEGDTSAHIVAWRWDGQVESLGPGLAFAGAWSELAVPVFESDADSTERIVLRAHARRGAAVSAPSYSRWLPGSGGLNGEYRAA
jgi:hypothetical protein